MVLAITGLPFIILPSSASTSTQSLAEVILILQFIFPPSPPTHLSEKVFQEPQLRLTVAKPNSDPPNPDLDLNPSPNLNLNLT